MAVSVCLSGGAGWSAAWGARSARFPTARVAATLAAIIRRDAHEGVRRPKTAVTVTKRCCGVRLLRIRYRAKSTALTRRGAYMLSLETRHGAVQGVAVSAISTEVGYGVDAGGWEDDWTYDFAIHHGSPGADDRWGVSVSYEDTASVGHAFDGGPPTGEASSQECESPAPYLPGALYDETLLFLGRAKLGLPLLPETRWREACVLRDE